MVLGQDLETKIVLRVNVSKNQGKFKKRGHGQKIDCAHTLSV